MKRQCCWKKGRLNGAFLLKISTKIGYRKILPQEKTHLTEVNGWMRKLLLITQKAHTLSCTCSLVNESKKTTEEGKLCLGQEGNFPANHLCQDWSASVSLSHMLSEWEKKLYLYISLCCEGLYLNKWHAIFITLLHTIQQLSALQQLLLCVFQWHSNAGMCY